MPRNHEQELEDYIRDGMARALWVHAYMIWATEVEPAPVLTPGTWDENAPDTKSSRRASGEAADDLAEMFRQANRLGDRPMAAVFMASAEGRAFARSHETESTEGDYAYAFGMTIARICLGTTEPEDSVLPLRPGLVVPTFHVELDDDGQELTWEGRADNEPRAWERNPVGVDLASAGIVLDYEDLGQEIDVRVMLHGRQVGDLLLTRRTSRMYGVDHARIDQNLRGRGIGKAIYLAIRERLKRDHGATLSSDDARSPDAERMWSGLEAAGLARRAKSRDYYIMNPGLEILLIEDEPALQRSTTRMIKKVFPGAEVIVADNADAAIANLQHHKFAHVVSDVDILGDRSGIDVFRWVEQNQPHMVDRYTFFTGNDYAQQVNDRVVMKPAGLAEFREAVLRGPVPQRAVQSVRPATRRTLTTDDAAAVLAVASAIQPEIGPSGRPSTRVGEEKVFIAPIWDRLSSDPQFAGVTVGDFKRMLVDANRTGILHLARADFVAGMDPGSVAASEISDRGVTFHFVLAPKSTGRQPTGAAITNSEVARAVVDVIPRIREEVGPGGRPRGRYGRQKVFIAAIWRQLQGDPRFRGMSEIEFKRHLLEANRERRLNLARADLVGAMDRDEVAQSEIDDRGASFHFVLDPSAKDPW